MTINENDNNKKQQDGRQGSSERENQENVPKWVIVTIKKQSLRTLQFSIIYKMKNERRDLFKYYKIHNIDLIVDY